MISICILNAYSDASVDGINCLESFYSFESWVLVFFSRVFMWKKAATTFSAASIAIPR